MDWLDIISTVGFPIAAAGYMAYLNAKQTETFNKSLNDERLSHKTEVDALKEALNNNTIVMEKISTIVAQQFDKGV